MSDGGIDVSEDEHTGKAVRVRWLDSGLAVRIGWGSRDDLLQPLSEVETVGIWLGQTDDMVFVAASRDAENDGWLGSQTIWRPAVRSVEWLEVA